MNDALGILLGLLAGLVFFGALFFVLGLLQWRKDQRELQEWGERSRKQREAMWKEFEDAKRRAVGRRQ